MMTNDKRLMDGGIRLAKGVAALLVALSSIYGTMWVIGIAPVTNTQAKDIAIQISSEESKKVWEQLEEQKTINEKIKESVKKNGETAVRIEESQRRTEGLQNKILQQLIRRND